MGTYRLDYAFRGGDFRLTNMAASQNNAPGNDAILPAGTGFWLTVHNKAGRQTHSQILRDPRTGGAAGGAVKDGPGVAFAPDPGPDGFVVFHMAFPAPDDTDFAGERVAVFPLKGGTWGVLSIFEDLLKGFRKQKTPAWLLILSDGFAAHELGKFESFARETIDVLCEMKPFDAFPLRSKIEVRSGPSTPGGAFGWKIEDLGDRLRMMIEADKAMAFVRTLDVDPINVLVVINDERYGGSGGEPAVAGLGSPDIPGNRTATIHAAIHELGHSAFALADEYSGTLVGAQTTPVELNVAHDEISARSKWGALLRPKNAGLPTDLATANARTVGMFPGAKYNAGNWRSQMDCRMKDVDQPFCAACRQVIRSVLECEVGSET